MLQTFDISSVNSEFEILKYQRFTTSSSKDIEV